MRIIIQFDIDSAMKGNMHCLIITIAFVLRETIEACSSPFTAVSNYNSSYCVKCDTTCATCFDETVNGCVTCITDFNLNENTSYCIPPDTLLIHTVQSSYKYYGFTMYGNWSGATSTNCGYTTLLIPSSTSPIAVNNYLGQHYGLRVIVSFWWLSPGGAGNTNILIKAILPDGTTELYSNSSAFSPSTQQVGNNSVYCTDSYATNFDTGVFNGASSSYITIRFSSASPNWGIRQYVLIQYLCNTTYCKTCTGPNWNDCSSCTDPKRRLYGTGKQCRCNTDSNSSYTGYFKHPDTDYCVWPCPSRLTGQYYGDISTQSCVLQCPLNSSVTYGVMFADDVSGLCVAACPATITIFNQTAQAYYHDVVNRRCVTNCPSTSPYKFSPNRTCLASCPNFPGAVPSYKMDSTMTCVTVCYSSTDDIPLFRDSFLNKCVDDCEGVDWWADYLTGDCTATCTGTNYFQDNTTTRNRCTQVCPAPLYFGDLATMKCIDHCYGGKFGDSAPGTLRHCVPTCAGGYYGLLTGNRACVPICPNQTWGENTTWTCVTVTTNCDSNRYADNYTHQCVPKGTCSLGQFSTDIGKKCVITCPSTTYANSNTMHCQTGCSGSWFADPGIPKCVPVCQTPNLYADTGSSNKCVSACNQSVTTKYRDFSTKKCVAICPDDPYTFSDLTTQNCVYNCSSGTYRDALSIPTNKRCVTNCVGNWGDNSTGYGVCVARCPEDPPLFGDTVAGFRICVQVCSVNSYGDQSPTGNRACLPGCPAGYFAQNDTLRRCVTRCNSTTYGYNNVCMLPELCPGNWVGDPSTNLCTNWCPQSQGTYADHVVSYLCVSRCPVNNSLLYFADPTDRYCRLRCTPSYFGNNNTQTCQTNCIDYHSFADFIHPYRYCILNCTNNGAIIYYRNNYTKTCAVAMDCPTNYFGDNVTKNCVEMCPINGSQTWGHRPTKTCVTKCYGPLWGDASTGRGLCVDICPSLPMKWSYNPTMLCVTQCPAADNLWGQDYTRTCIGLCPMHPTIPLKFTYAYNVTRRCLQDCPQGYFSDAYYRMCWDDPVNCSYGWGDDYNNSCTTLCTATPWDSYGDNLTHLCTVRCSGGSFADNYTGTRICVAVCPGSYDAIGVPAAGSFDSFGDNNTQSCVLHCVSPNTWADWQTHRCVSRCSDTFVPTYSQNVKGRCVIALWCPKVPDLLFGDNNTRSCKTSCYYNSTYTQWADNITRTCIPQCYNYTDATLVTATPWLGIDTRFYGDLSTQVPICVIQCPTAPRLFGENITNKCVTECPDNTYGDQTGNRSCSTFCPIISGVIWYTQITQHICVTLCEQGTWGNKHGRPHCETVPTDCIIGQYADNSTNLCVPLCPQNQNYFGDPSTRLCVDRCPTLLSPVINATASINMSAGYLYADYSTRLCVYRCPDDFGPYGTFGDNTTNTCVYRCPPGSFGDWQTAERYCVAVCTAGTFADELTQTCVSKCPASPPYFGETTNWTCVKNCPAGTWASAATRTCGSTCPPGQFRLTDDRTQCVDVCPSDPDLYGDSETNDCVTLCQNGTLKPFADPTDRLCKDSCLPLFQYNYRCVKYCPEGYYADTLGNCVIPTACDAGYYADNVSTSCVSPCTIGFADDISRYCIAVCPDNTYGFNNICRQNCTGPTSASTITQLCQSTCPDYTYHQNSTCKSQCQYGYANDISGLCDTSCPPNLWADPLTHDCVAVCYDNQTNDTHDWFRKNTGFCVIDCGTQFKDFVTGDCVDKCSAGYWGNKHNMTCIPKCITGEYGYEGATQRTCYSPTALPGYASTLFGDPLSVQYVTVCSIAPIVYFGDRITHQCVQVCANHSGTVYYGDPASRQCQSVCTMPVFYTADPITGRCQLICTQGTFRYNNTPICKAICPVGYADDTTNVCVAICPLQAGTFGFVNLTSTVRICMQICPDTYYSQPVHRTCGTTCSPPYFALNLTHQCVTSCVDSFADPSNNRCMDSCHSISYPNADNSTNYCVFQCPSTPDYYSDNHICVYYCTNALYFADPDSRSCVPRCPNVTGHNTYGDPTTGRCVAHCPLGYYADNSTNKCVWQCPTDSYGYDGTRECWADCPAGQGLYADPYTHMCAYTCSNGYFGSRVTQKCVPTCDADYWGDPLSTLCMGTCPNSIYSYGQNVTRTCVTSCVGYTGFADNMTRICRSQCQNLSNWLTFADPTTMSCVQMCPATYYMENTTNECRQQCLTGFADNYSRFCVQQCPDDPETYGDTVIYVCLYTCLRGEFSDNSTNLCVFQCPSTPNYFGDTKNGRCVLFCSQGTYAQTSDRLCVQNCSGSQYADNFTRRCVTGCPPAQATYADSTTNRCVRLCPQDWWADNSTQTCVQGCPDVTILGVLTDTLSDNITHYCVLQCPYPNFGRLDTNKCVAQCPSTPDLFGHPDNRVCVGLYSCYAVGGVPYYADDISRTCVQKCPLTRWADTTLFTCVPTCPTNYFRNNNNQMCVINCPTDPDEYADTSTMNCVRKCPGTYAVVNSTGYRICVSSCTPYGLIMDNITLRCVAVNKCATQPYMYGDLNAGQCVLYCTNSYFADNKTQTCVYTCPADWQLFGSTANYQCVNNCENYKFADALYSLRPRTCRPTCSNGYFADNETSQCVQRCAQIKPFYYQDIPSGACVNQCPGESYAYNSNQTCIYSTMTGSGYVSNCPGAFFADRISRSCVTLCPIGYFATTSTKYCEATCTGSEFADNETRTCTPTCSLHYFALNVNTSAQVCVQYCPAPYYAQNSSKSCVTGCSVLLALNQTRSCENYCPQPYYADWGSNLCVLTCAPNFANFQNRTCITPCITPQYSNPINFTCDLICPNGYFGRNNTRSCSQTCLIGFADPTIRICVAQCPNNPMLFAHPTLHQCVPICQTPYFAFTLNRTCISSCPNISSSVYLADSSNRQCVLQCVNNTATYADYSNNQCTSFCPNGTFASNLTKQCVPVCPNLPIDTFSDNFTHICMDVCASPSFGNGGTLNCVASCWWPLFGDPTTRLCVDYCPNGYFAQNQTATCRQTCQPGTYADPSTHRCVANCPAIENLFKFQNWTCLSSCPPGFFANSNISECVQICNSSNGMYAYDVSNQCVMECPYPYRGFDPNHTCILDCPSLYFYNKTRNVCTRCPMQCLTCISPTACMTCVPGRNLFNGQCSSTCQPSGSIITYAHPTNSMCVTTCPSTYFGDNSTYACIQTCPVKQYGSIVTKLCQNCPGTCAQCLNTSYCTSCQSNATMAIDHMCYSHCSTTQQYYYNAVCYSACPIGTYVSYNGVTCMACSVLCATCYGNASNCTSCSDSYYYNNSCLTQCPTGYYGSLNFTCVVCTSATSALCDQPLNFSTSVSIQNFQYVVSIKFNQNVSIQKQLQDILKIQLKVTRRMRMMRILQQTYADLINNGVSYTYVILSDGTIKVYLNLATDLVNPIFTVKFTDPTAIVSLQNGATLQTVTNDFTIDKVQYYPPQQSTNLPIKKAAYFTVIFILLLYAVTVLFTDVMVKPIQMLQLLFFHSVTSSPLSASMYFFILQLKLSLLQFLPNWPSIPLPKDITLHKSSTQKTIDIFIDFNFFRNVGHVFFYIVVAVGLWAIFMVLSNKRIVQNKVWHSLYQTVSVKRFRFTILNDVVSVLYVPLLWFGFSQFQELFSTGYLGFNGFVCLIFVIFCVLYPIGLFLIWWKKQQTQIIQRYPFMTNLTNKENERSSLQTPITYIYLLFSVIWLVGLDKYTTAQMILLVVTNFAYIMYLIISRPYIIPINTILPIFWCLILSTIQIFLIYFKVRDGSLTSSQKTSISQPLLITISVFMMLLIIWSVWRSVLGLMDVWRTFKESQFYKYYGDPQQEVQSEQSQVYMKYQKAVENNQPTLGDIVIDKIYKQCNQKGENVIKVRKKVLKKKKKPQGRGRKIPTQENDQDDEQKQYIRINKLNPFDYDYDDDFKPKERKDPMKRTFDDDLREMMSDEQEQKKIKKQSKSPNIHDKTQKQLAVGKQQKRVKNIEDLGNESIKEQSEDSLYREDIRYLESGSEQSKQREPQQAKDQSIKDVSEGSRQYILNEVRSQISETVPVKLNEHKNQPKQQQSQIVDEHAHGEYSQLKSNIQQSEVKHKENEHKQQAQKNSHRQRQSRQHIWDGLDQDNLQSSIKNEDQPINKNHNEDNNPSQKSEVQVQQTENNKNKENDKDNDAQQPKKQKPKAIQQLIEEQESNKKKKLLFLFQDFEED